MSFAALPLMAEQVNPARAMALVAMLAGGAQHGAVLHGAVGDDLQREPTFGAVQGLVRIACDLWRVVRHREDIEQGVHEHPRLGVVVPRQLTGEHELNNVADRLDAGGGLDRVFVGHWRRFLLAAAERVMNLVRRK